MAWCMKRCEESSPFLPPNNPPRGSRSTAQTRTKYKMTDGDLWRCWQLLADRRSKKILPLLLPNHTLTINHHRHRRSSPPPSPVAVAAAARYLPLTATNRRTSQQTSWAIDQARDLREDKMRMRGLACFYRRSYKVRERTDV